MEFRISILMSMVVCAFIMAYAIYDGKVAEVWFRRHLLQLKQRQQLPPEFQNVNIDTVDLTQYSLEIPGSILFRQSLSQFLTNAWYIWIPGVFAISMMVERLIHFVFKTKTA